MGDRIVVMKDGFIQQVDTPQNLYDYPINEFVAGFMGSPQMNFIDAKLGKNGNDYTLTFGACTITIPKKKVDGAIGDLASYLVQVECDLGLVAGLSSGGGLHTSSNSVALAV